MKNKGALLGMVLPLAGLSMAGALVSCSVGDLSGDDRAKRAREVVAEQRAALNDESREIEGDPALPSDWIPEPVIGRMSSHPLVEVGELRSNGLSLAESIEFLLPDWELDIVLEHPNDDPIDLGQRRDVRFRGGSLNQFLVYLSRAWNLDITSPNTGTIAVSSRRLEAWLVTHWMRPPQGVESAGSSGGGLGGQSNNTTNQTDDRGDQNDQNVSGGRGGSAATANAFAGLNKLVSRLAQLAARRAEAGAIDLGSDAGADSGSSFSLSETDAVWVSEESGVLFIWAKPNALRSMRPLLEQYGAVAVATDPELLRMMARGNFRLRLSLIRISVNNDRNASLRWEESLQAVIPSGSATSGLPGYGYGTGGTSRVDGQVTIGLGGEGLAGQIGTGLTRDRPVYPFGTRADLQTEQQRQMAYQQAVALDRDRTESDLGVIEGRIEEVEGQLGGQTLNAAQRKIADAEVETLRNSAATLAAQVATLGREVAVAGIRAATAGTWLDRITEADQRSWQRTEQLLVNLGSAHGETQIVQTASINARHGRLHPLQVGSERTYLSHVSQTVSQSFSQTAAEPETRLEGLALSMLPWLESRRCVRVGLALENSGVTSIASFAVAGTQLAIPQMAVQSWRAELRLCDAEPAVVARFKLESRTSTGGGLPVFGGRELPLSRSKTSSSEEYLLLVQAVLPAEWGLMR